jgi:murein DD-endopeptidase MepM/ murein hydrolase activator NlpD
MADDYYTLILIPDARSASRKIRVPVRLVRWTLRVVTAVALAAVGVLGHYLWLNWQMSELEALRVENAALAEQAQDYNLNLGRFEGQLSLLQHTVAKLGVISGVENALPGTGGTIGGVGGLTEVEATPPSRDPDFVVASLSQSLADLTSRSTRIESFYADQQELLARTPSIWPVRGYLSSGFGRRNDPFTGRPIFHPGIDVSAPRGTKVTAPADGLVVSVGRRGAYGKAIVIDHGHEIVTRYGHLDDYNVRAGQRVRRGDVIGFVGDTGRSNGPHLHYEVWVRDKLQNPIHYILDEYRSFGRS